MGKAMGEGEGGKVIETSCHATVQGTEKQTSAEVCLFHTLNSHESVEPPLVSMDQLPLWIFNIQKSGILRMSAVEVSSVAISSFSTIQFPHP